MATALKQDTEKIRLWKAYKKAEKYPLDWLWLCSGYEAPRPNQTHFESTSQIVAAAEVARKNKCQVPASVVGSLSDAIRNRRKSAENHALELGETAAGNHEHRAFIGRLERVLRILIPLSTTANQVRRRRRSLSARLRSIDIESSAGPSLNSFSTLGELPDSPIEDEILDEIAQLSDEDEQALPSENRQKTREYPRLRDDSFAEAMNLDIWRMDMDNVLDEVVSIWEEFAENKINLPLAAWLTGLGAWLVGALACQYESIAADAGSFIKKWEQRKSNKLVSAPPEKVNIPSGAGSRTDRDLAFSRCYSVLEQWMKKGKRAASGPEKIPLEKPEDAIKVLRSEGEATQDNEQDELDKDALSKLLAGLPVFPNTDFERDTIILLRKACVQPFRARLARVRDDGQPVGVDSVFCLELLLSSYKAFMCQDTVPQKRKRNCRLDVVSFIKQARAQVTKADANINPPRPTVILQGPKRVVEALDRALVAMTQDIRFNLFSQSPWVAGSEIAGIARSISAAGLAICNDSGFVCAVLHLYNALRHLPTPISEIIIFERLCEIFKDSYFLGSLPTENFSSHYRRAFGNGMIKGASGPGSKIKPVSSAEVRPKNQPNAGELCMFDCVNEDTNEDGPRAEFFWNLYEKRIRPQDKEKGIGTFRELEEDFVTDIIRVIRKSRERLQKDFEGEVPIASINWVAVYGICLGILRNLGDELKRPRPDGATLFDDPDSVDSMEIGFHWIGRMLESAVQVRRGTPEERPGPRDPGVLGVYAAHKKFMSFERTQFLNDCLLKFE